MYSFYLRFKQHVICASCSKLGSGQLQQKSNFCSSVHTCVVQEVKTGDTARVRNLLSRVTSLTLPPKKMKGFFR